MDIVMRLFSIVAVATFLFTLSACSGADEPVFSTQSSDAASVASDASEVAPLDGGAIADTTVEHDTSSLEDTGSTEPTGCTSDKDCDDGVECTQNICKKDGSCALYFDDGFCKAFDMPNAKFCTSNTSITETGCMQCNDTSDCVGAPYSSSCAPWKCINNQCKLQAPMPGISDVVCNDGNACTADKCGEEGTCISVPLPSGVTCNDGNFCTTQSFCNVKGTCVTQNGPNGDAGIGSGGFGVASLCNDNDETTYDWCDAKAQKCKYTKLGGTWQAPKCKTISDCAGFYPSDAPCLNVYCDQESGTCKAEKAELCKNCAVDKHCPTSLKPSIGGSFGLCDKFSPKAYVFTGKCIQGKQVCEVKKTTCLGCFPIKPSLVFSESYGNPYWCNGAK